MLFNTNKCGRCGKLMLYRTDGIPFCSECEKRTCAEIAQRNPKLAKKGKLTLVSRKEER